MSLYKVGQTWYVYVVAGGERVRRSARTSDKREAQRFHDELKAELWATKPAIPAGHTFTDAIKEWLALGERDQADKYRIRAIGLADVPLGDIDEERLAAILSRHKGSTRNRVINLIHAILQVAVDRGWLDRIPGMARAKTPPTRVRWLSGDEWDRLQRELPCHLRQMARFAVYTGLRENNVLGLTWAQVDMVRRVAWIHPDEAKANQAIGVPLSGEAMRVLEAQRGLHATYVFIYADHTITKASGASWYKAVQRAGLGDYEGTGKARRFVRNFRWHDLRHTWASWHVMAGTPLPVLQKLGGWQTVQMVMRYAHLAPEHLAQYAGNAIVPSHTKPEMQTAA